MKKFLAVLMSIVMSISCIGMIGFPKEASANDATPTEKTFADGDTTYVQINIPTQTEVQKQIDAGKDYIFKCFATEGSTGDLSVYGVTSAQQISACNVATGTGLPDVDLNYVAKIGEDIEVTGAQTISVDITDYVSQMAGDLIMMTLVGDMVTKSLQKRLL